MKWILPCLLALVPRDSSASTRCYFPADTAADVAPVANGAWGYTTEQLNRKLVLVTKSNTTLATGSRIGPWTAGQTAADRRYISVPLAAQTLSGTVAAQLMSQEFAGNDNSTSRLELYVVNNAGTTVTGTLLAIGQYGPATEFANGSLRNKTYADGDTISSLAINDGDRLVVVIGYTDAGGNTPEGASQYGDPTATGDLPVNESATSGVPWIEFSDTIETQGTSTFTDTATATGTSTPTDTVTGTVTDTATVTATATETATETGTATVSGTDTQTATESGTATATATDTETATVSGTHTESGTDTATATVSGTDTASATATETGTVTATDSGTATATATSTGSETDTGTVTATETVSGTDTGTVTASETVSGTDTGTVTASETVSGTDTGTATVTATFSSSSTATFSATATGTVTPTATSGTTMTFTRTPTVLRGVIGSAISGPGRIYTRMPTRIP